MNENNLQNGYKLSQNEIYLQSQTKAKRITIVNFYLY